MEFDEELFKQFTLWNDFETKLTYENRFFIKHDVIDILKDKLTQLESQISKDTIFYRARIFNEKERLDLNALYQSWNYFDERTKSEG